MPDLHMDVDVALTEVPVNIMPLIDDTDFKTIKDAVAYNAAGLSLVWHFVTTAGVYNNGVAVTPTTAGAHDWTDHGTHGIYTIEIPASGGTINNDTEGVGWFTGVATGVLPWRGPTICFRAAALNNLFIDDGNLLEDIFRLLVRSDAGIATDAAAALTRLNLDRGSGAGSFDNTAAPTVELTAAGVLAIWDRATADLDAASSIGKLFVDNLNATVSSRASQTSVDDVPTNAELATALITALTTALTEGYRGTGATGSVRDLLYELIAHMGESGIVSTTKTLKKLDGSTTAKTYTLNDATTPTSITEAT